MVLRSTSLMLLACVGLGACASGALPLGPRLVAVPTFGKTPAAARDDDIACRFNSVVLSTGWETYTMQAQYDAAYARCMYLRGEVVRPSNGFAVVLPSGPTPFPYEYGRYATGYGFGPARFVPVGGYYGYNSY